MAMFDAIWFKKNRGLWNEGLNASTLTSREVYVEDIAAYFRAKHGKKNLRYNVKSEPAKVAKILKLYQRVYGQERVTNKQLNLTFIRAVVAECKGLKVNWATYDAQVTKYRQEVRTAKAASEVRG